MTVTRIRLDTNDGEYIEVFKSFSKTGSTKKFYLEVECIEKVVNIELLKKFELKKMEYKELYGHVQIVKVFHGTKKSNIPAILRSNLDVRRHGQSTGHRFGAGISFSAFSNYSSHYCDEAEEIRQMLLCFVLKSNMIVVPEVKGRNEVLTQPPFLEGRYPLRYDTTAKSLSMNVIVKFEKDTFYPAYVIHFKKISKLSPSISVSIPSRIIVSNVPSPSVDPTSPLREQVCPPLSFHRPITTQRLLPGANLSRSSPSHSVQKDTSVPKSKPPIGRASGSTSLSTTMYSDVSFNRPYQQSNLLPSHPGRLSSSSAYSTQRPALTPGTVLSHSKIPSQPSMEVSRNVPAICSDSSQTQSMRGIINAPCMDRCCNPTFMDSLRSFFQSFCCWCPTKQSPHGHA